MQVCNMNMLFKIVWILIPACLIKQPNGTLSRMYVQTYISGGSAGGGGGGDQVPSAGHHVGGWVIFSPKNTVSTWY